VSWYPLRNRVQQKYHGQGHIVAPIVGDLLAFGKFADGGLRLKIGRFVACLAMVGVGAIAGTLGAGYTNAARSPEAGPPEVAADRQPAVVRAGSVVPVRTVAVRPGIGLAATAADNPADADPAHTTTVAKTVTPAVPAQPAPTSVVAQRFPSHWQQALARAGSGDNDTPAEVLAYAPNAQPQQAEREAPAASGYQLASVDRAAEPGAAPTPMPKRVPKAAPKQQVLFNDAQLASIKARLRLTRDQEAYWPQVEAALRAISWKIATQSKGVVSGKQQAQMIDPSSPEVARLKSAAFPLIMSMREDQKQEVRQLAHTMGLKQVASMF
jgi:hypothetical protein